jgi:hypothetical protein
MKSINALIAVSLASAVTGWITGQAWILGSRAAEQGLWWLVVLAVPSNLAIAALHYYLLRGAVHHSGGGIGLYVVLAAVNLAISVGVASMAADAIGAGDSAKIGAHAFSWGICYAYGQAFHDVRHGTWLHE